MKQENNQGNIKFLSDAVFKKDTKSISLETFKIIRRSFIFKDDLDISPLENLKNFRLDVKTVQWDSYEDHIEFLKDLQGKELAGSDVFIYFANASEIKEKVDQLKYN